MGYFSKKTFFHIKFNKNNIVPLNSIFNSIFNFVFFKTNYFIFFFNNFQKMNYFIFFLKFKKTLNFSSFQKYLSTKSSIFLFLN